MKCHTCKSELLNLYDILDCPEGHVTIEIDSSNNIIGYRLFWDADADANERYKLVATQKWTILYICDNTGSCKPERYDYVRKKHYNIIFETPSFIPISIKEDVLQVNNLIDRLKKLVVFS